jgi:hypothetical protein
MPKHKPIKFESLDYGVVKQIKKIISENKTAKSALNATLAIMATGGIITLGAMAPGLLMEINKISRRKRRKETEKYREIWRNFNSLKKKGNLEFVKEEDDCLFYKFSEKGENKVRKFIIDELRISPPKEWDKKWRLIIFDIPEKKRGGRVAFRKKLNDMGFYQCQKSAWIHPFPCLEEIEFVKDVFNLKPFVKIFLVDEMTDGKTLYHFKNLLKEVPIK